MIEKKPDGVYVDESGTPRWSRICLQPRKYKSFDDHTGCFLISVVLGALVLLGLILKYRI